MRSAQHFHLGDVHEVEIVVFLANDRHIVDVEPHRRLVDACAQSPHIDGGGHPTPIIGYEDVGDEVGSGFCSAHGVALNGCAPDIRCGKRMALHVGALLNG